MLKLSDVMNIVIKERIGCRMHPNIQFLACYYSLKPKLNILIFLTEQIYPPINVLPSLSRLMKVKSCLFDIKALSRDKHFFCLIIGHLCRVLLVREWPEGIMLMYPTRSDIALFITLLFFLFTNHLIRFFFFSSMQIMLLERMFRQWKQWLERKHFHQRTWSLIIFYIKCISFHYVKFLLK